MELNKFNQSTKYFTRSESGPTFKTSSPKEAIKEVITRAGGGAPVSIGIAPGVELNPLGTIEDQDPSIQGQLDVGGGKLGFGVGKDKSFIQFRKQFDEGGLGVRAQATKDIQKSYDTLKKELNRNPTIKELIEKSKYGEDSVKTNIKKLNLKMFNLPGEFRAPPETKKIQQEKKKTTLQTKKINKPTLFGEDDVRFPNEKIKQDFFNDLKADFKFPFGSDERKQAIKKGEILSVEGFKKKYYPKDTKISQVKLHRSLIAKKENLNRPKKLLTEKKQKRREKENIRRGLIKEVSKPGFERSQTRLAKGVALDTAHRASLRAVKDLGGKYLTSQLGFDPEEVNRSFVKPFEKKINNLHEKRMKLIKNLEPNKVPLNIQKKLSDINKQISNEVARTDGALQAVLVDEKTLKPIQTGVDYSKVIGAGVIDKPIQELTETDKAIIDRQSKLQIENLKRPTQLFSGAAALPEMARLGGEVLTQDIPKASSVVEQGLKNLRLLRPIAYETGFGAAFAPVDFVSGRPMSEILLDIPTLGIAGQTLRAQRLRQTVGPEVFDKIQEQRAARSEGVGGIESAMFEDFDVDETPLEEAIQARADREAEVAKKRQIEDVSESDVFNIPKQDPKTGLRNLPSDIEDDLDVL